MNWFMECAPILRAVRLHRHQGMGKAGKVLIRLGLAGVLAGLVAGAFLVAHTRVGWSGALVLFGGGLVGVFGSLALLNVASVGALQNHPANAVLVPRLNRLVRRTAILLWTLAMAGFAVLGTAMPHGVLAPLAAHAFLMPVLAARGPGALAWTMVFPLPWLIGMDRVLAVLDQPLALALCWAAALLLGWRCLVIVFPRGGERHYVDIERSHKADRMARSMHGWALNENAGKRRRPEYARQLARDIRRGRAGELMMHVFGPGCQLADHLKQLLMYGAICLLVKLAVLAWWPQQHASIAHMVIMVALGSIGGLATMAPFRFASSIGVTVGEQGLYRLAPAAPRSDQLNRRLAGRLLRTCLLAWAAGLLLLLGIILLWDASSLYLMGGLTVMCGTLCFVAWPLRDQAHDPGMVNPVLIVLLVLMSIGGVVAYLTVGQWWVWALMLAVALMFIGWRYRSMLRSPPAFPARRLPAQ